MDDLITLLKQETLGRPSLVSFRNLGAVGHTVTVKRIRSASNTSDQFEWSYQNTIITEAEACDLLKTYKPNRLFNSKRPNFNKYLKKG